MRITIVIARVFFMFRFFLIVTFITAVGFIILTNFDFNLAANLVVFVGAIMIIAPLFKIALDIYLHFDKEEDDETDERSLLRKGKVKTVYEPEDYAKAVAELDKKRQKK